LRYILSITAALVAGIGPLRAAQPAAKGAIPAKTAAKRTAAKKSAAAKSAPAKATSAKSASTKSAAAKTASLKAPAKAPLKTSRGGSKTASAASRAAAANMSKTGKTGAKKATAANYHRSLQQQPTPDRYREIQQALADKGYFGGPVDGNWGPDSVEALKRFQHDQNLTDDGKIGSLSLIALGLGPKHDAPATLPDRSSP